jgi:hypothetical protein
MDLSKNALVLVLTMVMAVLLNAQDCVEGVLGGLHDPA